MVRVEAHSRFGAIDAHTVRPDESGFAFCEIDQFFFQAIPFFGLQFLEACGEKMDKRDIFFYAVGDDLEGDCGRDADNCIVNRSGYVGNPGLRRIRCTGVVPTSLVGEIR